MPEITDPSFLAELNGGGAPAPAPRRAPPPVIVGAPPVPPPMTPNDQIRYRRDFATLPSDIAKTDADAANAQRKPFVDDRDDRRSLSDDYRADPAVKNYEAALPVYISGLQTSPTPQGDNSLIYSYAKVMDPGSVVREGEAAAIANSQPFFEKTITQLQTQLGQEGGSFSERTRQRLRLEMRRRVHELDQAYNSKRRDYRDTANRYGYNEREVIGTHLGDDYRPAERAFIESLPQVQGATAGAAAGADAGRMVAGAPPAAPASATLQTPELRPSGTDEVRVPLLDGGDGNTNLQAGQDRIAAEVQQLLTQGATKEQLDEYVTRRGRELGINTPVFSQWGNADAVIKARDAGQQFQVGSPKIEYNRSDARGSEERDQRGVVGSVLNGAFNPGGALLEAAGNTAELAGMGGARDTTNAVARGVRSGATLAWDDEIAALLKTAYEGGATDFAQRYDEKLGEERATDAYDEENNFGARLGGQLIGSALLPTRVPVAGSRAGTVAFRDAFAAARARGLGVAEARAEARALANRAARSGAARQAGVEGAAAGSAFGAGDAEGGVGDRLGGAATGGVLGGALGYGVTRAAPEIGNALAQWAGSPRRAPPGDIRVAQAAADEGVPVGQPVINPELRDRMMSLDASLGGNVPVRNAMARTDRAIDDRVSAVGGGGSVRPVEELGQMAQTAGRRRLDQTRGLAQRLYRRAEASSAGMTFRAGDAVAELDAQIGELSRNPNTNSALLNFLRGIRSDFVEEINGTPTMIPKTIEDVRNIRTGLRGQIDRAGLTYDDADRRVERVLRAADNDIQRELAAAPDALRLYRRADRIWQIQKEEERQILGQLIGRNDNPKSGTATVAKLREFMRADPGRLQRFTRMLTREERADFSATIANGLGRNNPGDNFALGTFMNNTKSMSDASLRALFGADGARSIANLRVLSRAVMDTKGRLNNSRSGAVIARQWFTNVVLPLIPSAVGGGYASGGIAAAAAGAFAGAVRPAYQFLSARALMNADLSRWLSTAARAPSIEALARHVDRLPAIAGRNPAIAVDIEAIQRAIANALNDNRLPAAAASSDESGGQQ